MLLDKWLNPKLLDPGLPAPPFRLINQQGECVELAEVLAQSETRHVVLLFFTGTRGVRDIGLLKAYAKANDALKEAGIAVVALSATNWETLHHFATGLNLPFPVLFDVATKMAKQYGAVSLSGFVTGQAVFVVAKDGAIRYAQKGGMNPQQLVSQIAGSH